MLKQGTDEEALIQSLMTVFKIPDAQVRKLVTIGRPVTIKGDLNQATAEKYRQLMDKLGMQVHIEAQTPAVPPLAPIAARATPPVTDPQTGKADKAQRCPNCGSDRVKEDDCLACGIILSRYLARKTRLAEESENNDAAAPDTKRPSRRYIIVASIAAVSMLAAFYLLKGHDDVTSITSDISVTTKEGLISLDYEHVLAINAEGHIYGFGQNSDHKLGHLYSDSSPIPRLVSNSTVWRYVNLGDNVSLAIDASDRLWRRMYVRDYDNRRRGSHDNVIESEIAPFEMIPYLKVDTELRFTKAMEAGGVAVALDTDKKLWVWREEQKSESNFSRELQMPAPQRTLVQPYQEWRDFCVKKQALLAIDADGALWRINEDELKTFRYAKEEVNVILKKVDSNAPPFQRVFCNTQAGHVVLLDSNGELWGYGSNSYGQFGIGNVHSLIFDIIVHLAPGHYADVAVGAGYTLAIRTDGSLWGWGLNTSKQIGIGDKSGGNKPILIDKSHTWIAVAATHETSAGMTSDGGLYTWGTDNGGTLGAGAAAAHPIPLPVYSEEKWGGLAE